VVHIEEEKQANLFLSLLFFNVYYLSCQDFDDFWLYFNSLLAVFVNFARVTIKHLSQNKHSKGRYILHN